MQETLPIFDIASAFHEAMEKHGCAVITAPTGSGKSTQIPKMLLKILEESAGQILVLQPRRLAARMLAERVAWELGEKPGETVGYITKYERKVTGTTRIVFITEGVLTRRISDTPELPGVAAVIFDEFHERTVNSDLALAMVRETRLYHHPSLKLVVMSATLDARPICAYLGDCPLLESDGRLHPVSIRYTQGGGQLAALRNVGGAIRTVIAENSEGDVLVFLPGAGEINRCAEECRQQLAGQNIDVLPLYGEMPPEEQHRVMENINGRRKLILATNIAQTSLTIPGVRHVIDTGLVRQNHFDSLRGLNRLDLVPIARDAADQRAGRAGREAPGTCLRLWTQLEQNAKPSATQPEICRVDLAEAVLTVYAYGYKDCQVFPWFEKPPQAGLLLAVKMLEDLGLSHPECGGLTELGQAVRRYPLHPRLALLLYRGSKNGCPALACLACAILSERPLLSSASADRALLTELRQDAKRHDRSLPASDFLAEIRLLEAARRARYERVACERLGVNGGAARDIDRAANALMPYVKEAETLPSHEAEEALLKCLLMTFPDKIAKRRHDGNLRAELPGRKLAEISPTSLVRDEEFFLSAEIRQVAATGVQSVKTQLSLNSGFPEEWLWELFPDFFEDRDECFLDERKEQVFRRRSLTCLGLLLEETISSDPEPEQASALLADYINAHSLHLQGWDEAVEHWLNKLAWLALQRPDLALPDCSDRSETVKAICAGETSYKNVKFKPCLPALKAMLTPEQLRQVEQLAPDALPLPRGRKLKIEYFPDHPPRGRARIQDLYDLKGPVTIVNGTVPILLDILAPNMRTVQITDDLERFWKVHYPALKSALARRYPKHEWR